MKKLILVMSLCGFLLACQHSPNKNYYVLTPQSQTQKSTDEKITQVIGIGPVEVAGYLNRSRLVYLAEDTRLTLANNDYWAEPLDSGIARVIALNLTQKNSARSFVTFPWRSDSRPRYSLRLQIHSLDRRDGQAEINAAWEIIDNQEKAELERHHFIRSLPAGSGAPALIRAYSQLFANLADDIDGRLNQLP